jgi:hypothetical protein
MTSALCCQPQVNAVYFDLSNVFDLVSHNVLLQKSSPFGFSDGYFSWFGILFSFFSFLRWGETESTWYVGH